MARPDCPGHRHDCSLAAVGAPPRCCHLLRHRLPPLEGEGVGIGGEGRDGGGGVAQVQDDGVVIGLVVHGAQRGVLVQHILLGLDAVIGDDEFLTQAREKYYATVRHLNFGSNPQGALDTINYWAALMTNDRIKSLSIDVNPNTQLVLNNACYFKAKWKFPFEGLGENVFSGVQNQSQRTEFMEIESKYMKCAETNDYQAVVLDYANGDFDMKDTTQTWAYSMIVILPKEGRTLDEVLPTLQLDSIPFQKQTCNVIMPKFEMRGNYQLANVLSELEISDIFTRYPNAIIDPMESLYVSQIAQDYFVKVDEEGTEAAVVTSVVADIKMMLPEAKFKMNCNRPFAFVIRENTTGLLLFMGEYDDVPGGNY